MRQDELYHYGVKGMKWKNHKYTKISNGEYIYDVAKYTLSGQGIKDSQEVTKANEKARMYYDRKLDAKRKMNEDVKNVIQHPRDKEYRRQLDASSYWYKDSSKKEEYYRNTSDAYWERMHKYGAFYITADRARKGKEKVEDAIDKLQKNNSIRKNKRQTNRKNRQFLRNRQYKKA